MKKVGWILFAVLALGPPIAHADSATEQEVTKTIKDRLAYGKKNLKAMDGTVAREGSLEFWSSGGLLQELDAEAAPEEFDAINLSAKHITIITLAPGEIAVAQYYSEGSLSPKNSAGVSDYRTRVTEVFVKEGGRWKTRAAHYSPIVGGTGTSQIAVDD